MIYLPNGGTPILVGLLIDATDDVSVLTGVTPTVQISKNGGSFATCTNAASEIDNGWYKVTLTATETNTDGPLIFRMTHGSAHREWRQTYQVGGVPVALTTEQMNQIADHVLGRLMSNVSASSDRDIWTTNGQYTLYGAVLATAGKNVVNGAALETYDETESSVEFSRDITTDADADPITSLA